LILTIFLLLLYSEPRTKISLTVSSSFEIESEDFFFSQPDSILAFEDGKLYLIDEKTKTFIIFDLPQKKFVNFADDSQAPEGISNPIGFFVKDDHVVIHSDFGKKISKFSFEGTLLDTMRNPDPIFYLSDSTRLSSNEGQFVLEAEGQVVFESPFFDAMPFGPYKYVLGFGDLCAVATSTSNNQTFEVVTFDLKSHQSISRDSITKVQQFGVEDIPEAKAMGLTNANFRTSSFATMAAVGDKFYFYEYMYPKARKEEWREVSIVHTFTPKEKQWQTLQIHHPGVSQLAFLIPLKANQWLAFDASQDRFLIMLEKFK
jgi:hypothetical protein